MTDNVAIDKLVRVYLRMRAKREELKAAYEAEDEAVAAQQATVKDALMAYCKENNVESGSTASGGFYRKTVSRYWTNDWDSMNTFIIENRMPELLERRLHQSNMQALLKEHPELLPPGLNIDSKFELVVTTPRKKAK